jgi:hypothetical protein
MQREQHIGHANSICRRTQEMLKKVFPRAVLVVSLAADAASANQPPLKNRLSSYVHVMPDPIIIIFELLRSLRY